MNNLISQKPFYSYYDTVGVLSKGSVTLNNIQIIFYHSDIYESGISGLILGKRELFENLLNLSHGDGHFLSFISNNNQISCNSITLGKTEDIHAMKGIYVVAEITAQELKINSEYWSAPNPKRIIKYYVAGPRTFLSPYFSSSLFDKCYGSTKAKDTFDTDSQIVLKDSSFDIRVEIVDFHSKAPKPDDYSMRKEVLAISMETVKERDILSDEECLIEAEHTADMILLIMSFVSKSWLTWFKYRYTADECEYTVIRQTRKCVKNELDVRKGVIDISQVKQFLPQAFYQHAELLRNGIDLREIILFYVSGNEDKTLEMQFVTTFMALEMLRDSFCIENELTSIISASDWEPVKKDFCKFLQERLKKCDDKTIHRMLSKIDELNRPSIRAILKEILHKFSIDWRDLYPKDARTMTFIDARNKLLHTKQHPNVDDLFKELYRLRAIVERIILKMLKWDDLKNTPEYWIKDWISK